MGKKKKRKKTTKGGGGVDIGIDIGLGLDINRLYDQIVRDLKGLDLSIELGPFYEAQYGDLRYDNWLLLRDRENGMSLCGTIPRFDHESKENQIDLNLKEVAMFDNDAACAVIARNVRQGDVLLVFDDPCGCKTDDWSEIEIRRDAEWVFVRSFEMTRTYPDYKVTWHKGRRGKVAEYFEYGNYLEGKVSHVKNYRC